MKNRNSTQTEENLFLWSAGEITQIREKMGQLIENEGTDLFVDQSPDFKDIRRYPRLDLKLPILYKVLGQNPSGIPPTVRPFLATETSNVSPLGLCLKLSEKVSVGTALALTIHDIRKREKFDALGQVIWIKPSPHSSHYLTGVQFVVVDDNNIQEEKHARVKYFIDRIDKK